MFKCLAIGCNGITGVISTKDAIRIRKCHSCGCYFKTREEYLKFVEEPVKRGLNGRLFEVPALLEPGVEILYWSGAE